MAPEDLPPNDDEARAPTIALLASSGPAGRPVLGPLERSRAYHPTFAAGVAAIAEPAAPVARSHLPPGRSVPRMRGGAPGTDATYQTGKSGAA